MESDTVSESLTDQVGGILKVRVTSIQKLDTGFSGGILKFQTLVSQWDTEKKCQFQTLYKPFPLRGSPLTCKIRQFWKERISREGE